MVVRANQQRAIISRIDLAYKNLLANSSRSFGKKDIEETAIRNVENFADKRDEVLPLSSILLTLFGFNFRSLENRLVVFSASAFENISISQVFFSIVLHLPQKKNQHFQNDNSIRDQGPSRSHKMVFEALRVTVEYDYGDIFSSGELVHVPQSITK